MRIVISILFSFGIMAFIGIWYFLFEGSPRLLGTGLGLFTLVVGILLAGFSYKVLQNSDLKTRIVFLLYMGAFVTTIYGLVIRIMEALGRYQHPIGLKVFFIGLGSLIVLLILQFIILLFSSDENQDKVKENA